VRRCAHAAAPVLRQCGSACSWHTWPYAPCPWRGCGPVAVCPGRWLGRPSGRHARGPGCWSSPYFPPVS
jgi:hypothetical protein